MQRTQALDAGFQFRRYATLHQLGANFRLNFFQKFVVRRLVVADFLLQSEKGFRLENAEGKILEFIANESHAEAVGDRRINFQSFACDTLLLVRLKVFDSAHVVEPVGEFDDHDANIVDHGQNHLANVFGLARFGGQHVEAANFGYAFDEPGSFFAKTFLNARNGKFSVFNYVMEKSGGKRGGVHAHVGENVRDFQEMCEIGIAGAAELVAMALRGNFVGAANQPGIIGRTIFLELL